MDIKKIQWKTKEQRAKKMIEAKKNERANALKEAKRLCKNFGVTAGMLKEAPAEGCGEK